MPKLKAIIKLDTTATPPLEYTTGADYIDIPYNPYKDRIYETPAPTGGPYVAVERNTNFDHLVQTTAIPNYDDIVSP